MANNVIRGDGVDFPKENRVTSSSTIDIYDDTGKVIGFCVGLRESMNRPVQKLRHLSAGDAGRVIEVVPMIEDIQLTVTGYSLYDRSRAEQGSLIHRMGSAMKAMKSLVSQNEPFFLIKTETHPSTGEQVIDAYYDCWITAFSRDRDINRLVVVDSCTIAVGQKE